MRGFKVIRGYVIGALAGAVLMLGVQAGASGTLTGSKVAGTKIVTFNGKDIGQAAIINNSSYLPVRSVSDAMGLQINLSGGAINLTEAQQATVTDGTTSDSPPDSGQSTPTQSTLTADEINRRISETDKSIKYCQDTIENGQKMIDALTAQGQTEDAAMWQRTVDEAKASLPKLQQQKSDLEAQLQALQNQ